MGLAATAALEVDGAELEPARARLDVSSAASLLRFWATMLMMD